LDDFGIFLGRKRNRFVVKHKDKKDEILADDVEAIICTSKGVSLSASALHLAMSHNIQVVFAKYSGWPVAILMPTTITGSVRARREQFLAYNDDRGITLAEAFVAGKMVNQANLLRLLAKNRKPTQPILAEKIYKIGRAISDIIVQVSEVEGDTVDEKRQRLMNVEAEGARLYWNAIKQILPAELEFTGRITRGAKDSFNAMLNLGYQAVLYPEVWKAVSYVGLDPYAGYLHADRSGKPSLVLDLMEEFRQQVVDRTLISLLSKGEIKPNEILTVERVEERQVLARNIVKTILTSLQERLDAKAMFNGHRIQIKNFIHSQARQIVRFLLKEANYAPFVLGW
jgi:CRISPR-associated protein Cas1